MDALEALVNPPFAKNPPVKLDMNARTVGLIVAGLAALGILFGLAAIGPLLSYGGLLAGYGHPGVLFLAVVGVLVALVGAVVAVIGGWQMYRGSVAGKRLVIYALAIGFLGEVIYGIGFTFGAAIVPLLVYAALYYVVVISRFPPEPTATGRG
jgi:hypothetical protein